MGKQLQITKQCRSSDLLQPVRSLPCLFPHVLFTISRWLIFEHLWLAKSSQSSDRDDPTHLLIHSFFAKPTYLGIHAYVGSTWSPAVSLATSGLATVHVGSTGHPIGTMRQKPLSFDIMFGCVCAFKYQNISSPNKCGIYAFAHSEAFQWCYNSQYICLVSYGAAFA